MGDEQRVTLEDVVQGIAKRILNEVSFRKAEEVLELCRAVESLVCAQRMQESAIRELVDRERERLA